jgi:alpha-L-fucosidase 2
VFPAVPSTWKDIVFQDLRTEGAFLVTAARRGGSTKVVRLTSLAGEPATLEVVMKDATVQGSGTRPPIVKAGENRWRLLLAKGETVTLVAADATAADQVIAPVAADPGKANPFGVR